jgi:hypothetical protein
MSRANRAEISMWESGGRARDVGLTMVKKTCKQLHSSTEEGIGGTLGTNGTERR